MTKGESGVFHLGIGGTDPRSQKRDLGHPSIVSDTSSWGVVLLAHPDEFAAWDTDWTASPERTMKPGANTQERTSGAEAP
jgi:hypothetical protein